MELDVTGWPNPRRLVPAVNPVAFVRPQVTEMATFCCVFQGIHQNGLCGRKPSGNLGLGRSPRLCTRNREKKRNMFYVILDNKKDLEYKNRVNVCLLSVWLGSKVKTMSRADDMFMFCSLTAAMWRQWSLEPAVASSNAAWRWRPSPNGSIMVCFATLNPLFFFFCLFCLTTASWRPTSRN